jgi:hypothetical protein
LRRDLIAASSCASHPSFLIPFRVSRGFPASPCHRALRLSRVHHLSSFISSYSPSAMFIAIWC